MRDAQQSPTMMIMDIRCTRHFLGWDQPSLDNAARWILDRYLQDSELDLSDLHVVLPGRRAARALLGNLVDLSEKHGCVLIPPITLTPLEIPASMINIVGAGLSGGLGTHASPISQRLAWIEAIQSIDASKLTGLLPNAPEPDDWDQWIGIGGWIGGLSDELCDAGLRINEVADRGALILDETESERWDALGDVQDHYERILKGLGIVDDRLVALDHSFDDELANSSAQQFIFIGLPELGSIARSAVELAGCIVDSLIFAPEILADRFDEYGCVLTDQWLKADIDIDENRILFEDTPSDMCEQALAQLALRGERMGNDAIDSSSCVIGLADETLIGSLRQHASLAGPNLGIELHAPMGQNASSTPPGQLIALLQAYLRNQTFDSLADLSRHPVTEHAIATQYFDSEPDNTRPAAWWLSAIDQIHQDHMLTNTIQVPAGAHPQLQEQVAFVIRVISELLEPLLVSPGQDRTVVEWANRLSDTLGHLYKDIELDVQSQHDGPTIEGLKAIRRTLDEINDADKTGQLMPVTSSQSAMALILDRLGEIMLAENINRDAIETLGWLELPLDPSPICIVVGMSESCVPGSVTHDPLLPGSLRNELSMSTNDDRLARDTFLMTGIHASRDAVFMCARNGDKNDPVTPSRLLLRASGAALAKRLGRFVDPSVDQPSRHSLAKETGHGLCNQYRKTLRVCGDYVAPESMSVTDFDAFLRSPAQWYLERKLRLREIDTGTRELSPSHLGSLIHSILEAFGKDETMRNLDDPDSINDALIHLLDLETKSQFGTMPTAAVAVQTQLLHPRLGWFATQQALRRRQGWSIAHTEWSPEKSSQISILVDGVPMGLSGKIDRIDTHEDGRFAVIDYKTGKVEDALKAHQKKDTWLKLQLPLYRFLVHQLVGNHELLLGYAGLPSIADEEVWKFADWDQDELDSADETARQIIRRVREMSPGDVLDLGDSPPDAGILGFITGQRFDVGGHEQVRESETEETGVAL